MSRGAVTVNVVVLAGRVSLLPTGRARGLGVCEAPHVTDPRDTVVFRWLAAGDAGDLDAFDDLFHPDAVVHAPLGLSTVRVEDEKAVWADALTAMPGIRHDVEEVVVEGDVEMARVVVSGTMASAFAGLGAVGKTFRIDQAVITHLRAGKIVEAWEIADVSALQAQITG